MEVRRRAAPAGRERWRRRSRCCWYAPARPLPLRPPPTRLEGHSTGYSSGYCRGYAVCPRPTFQPPPHPDDSQPPLARIALPAALGAHRLRRTAATNQPISASCVRPCRRSCGSRSTTCALPSTVSAARRTSPPPSCAAAFPGAVRHAARGGHAGGAVGYHLSTLEYCLIGRRACVTSELALSAAGAILSLAWCWRGR